MKTLIFTHCLFVYLFLPHLGWAAPDTQSVLEKLQMQDSRLIELYLSATKPIQELFAAHIDYPGSLSAPHMHYLPDIEELSENYQALLSAISFLPRKKKHQLFQMNISLTRRLKHDFQIMDPAALQKWSATLTKTLLSLPQMNIENFKDPRVDARPFVAKELMKSFAEYDTDPKPNLKRKIQNLLSLLFLLQSRTRIHPETKILLQKKNGLGSREGEIDILEEALLNDQYQKGIEWVLFKTSKRIPPAQASSLMKLSAGLLQDTITGMHAQVIDFSQQEPSQTPSLIIKEIPPEVAVLRGLVGNDCSTQKSFGFPFSPREKSYYILSENKTIGYIAASEVFLNGKKSLFLHTIAGPQIDPVQTSMILEGFFLNLNQLGYEKMMLPEHHRIMENVNFSAIRKAMEIYVKTAPLKDIAWKDAYFRNLISRYGSDLFYDSPERNQFARKFSTSQTHVKVSTSYQQSLICTSVL